MDIKEVASAMQEIEFVLFTLKCGDGLQEGEVDQAHLKAKQIMEQYLKPLGVFGPTTHEVLNPMKTWSVYIEDVHGDVLDQTEVEARMQSEAEQLGDTIFKETGLGLPYAEGYPEGYAVHAYVNVTVTPAMKIRAICRRMIAKHTALSIDPSRIMYAYGSEDEFKAMIADIEKELDVILLPPRDVDLGEKTVHEFIEGIVEACLEEDEEEDVDHH